MGDARHPQGQGAPIFFLSYAKNRNRTSQATPEDPISDDKVLRFYHDLRQHVRQLVGSKTGDDPGFMDQSMRAGVEWQARLLRMLEIIPVFVALLSVDYVDSAWCGMEWDAFSRRRPVRRDGKESDDETTILPIIWSPLERDRVLPLVVRSVQRFTPDIQLDAILRKAYLDNGVYGLLAMNSPYYGVVVWQVARAISDLYHTFTVSPPADPLDGKQLGNVFERTAS